MENVAWVLSVVGVGLSCILGWYAWKTNQELMSEKRRCDSLRMQESELVERLGQCEKEVVDIQHSFDSERRSFEDEIAQLRQDVEKQISVEVTKRQGVESGALNNSQMLASEITSLLDLVKTFERWHADMNELIIHNRAMHEKNDQFAMIVKHMIIVTLNASIEAARAGTAGRGFAVVADEMRSLAARAETLSTGYRTGLYQNDLITTTTFQDLQAGGKMIVSSLTGLGLINRRISEELSS